MSLERDSVVERALHKLTPSIAPTDRWNEVLATASSDRRRRMLLRWTAPALAFAVVSAVLAITFTQLTPGAHKRLQSTGPGTHLSVLNRPQTRADLAAAAVSSTPHVITRSARLSRAGDGRTFLFTRTKDGLICVDTRRGSSVCGVKSDFFGRAAFVSVDSDAGAAIVVPDGVRRARVLGREFAAIDNVVFFGSPESTFDASVPEAVLTQSGWRDLDGKVDRWSNGGYSILDRPLTPSDRLPRAVAARATRAGLNVASYTPRFLGARAGRNIWLLSDGGNLCIIATPDQFVCQDKVRRWDGNDAHIIRPGDTPTWTSLLVVLATDLVPSVRTASGTVKVVDNLAVLDTPRDGASVEFLDADGGVVGPIAEQTQDP